MTTDHITLPRGIKAREITGYAGTVKQTFHRDGKKFLKAVAKAIGLQDGTFDLRSNMGGPAVSGEITLHSDDLYIQLYESGGSGAELLYRACRSRRDYTGLQNNFMRIDRLDDEYAQERFLDTLKNMVATEQKRKATPSD